MDCEGELLHVWYCDGVNSRALGHAGAVLFGLMALTIPMNVIGSR